MTCLGYRNPQQQSFDDTFRFLVWDQFPAILERSVRYFAVLPQIGIYKQVRDSVKPFMQALHDNVSREFTLSGVGSLIDYEKFGHQIKRPSPQLVGTGCNANSLCIEPTCFGFTEGVIESTNILQNICWSLSMPCLKDFYYSDRQFDRKMKQYFAMFFKQAPAVLQAYQRTRLIKEAIKIVCTDTNFRYTGPVIGGADGISLPFYIDPTDAISFPDTDNLPAGVGVGGANLMAFMHFLAPRLFAGAFDGGMEGFRVYGLKQDYMVAKEQTASVQDHFMDMEMIRLLSARTGSVDDKIDGLVGEFVHDGLFPTFKLNTGNQFEPVTQEVLEPATIAGYVQTSNPEHALAQYRALLFVPNNWMFSLVEPPKDDFSDLGLGQGLNFRTNTPGNFPILSSSMFTRNQIGQDGTVILGQAAGPNGMMVQTAQGLRARERALREAVRTEVLMTYSNTECNNASASQLPNVGPQLVPQGRADGFRLKSTMHIATDVRGTAKPVLLIFKTDTPRSARPIEVCTVEEIEVDQTGSPAIESCCPGGQIYAVLTFTGDASGDFSPGDTAVYRTGARGETYLVDVTAVSGSVVTIESRDDETLLPCCSGSPDDYGTRGTLINDTTPTLSSSEIMKAEWDTVTSALFIETFEPLVASTAGDTATITLENGDVINVVTANNAVGVFVDVQAAGGETCDLSALACNCLVNAVFTLT